MSIMDPFTLLFGLIFAIIILGISLVLSIAISQPFSGALVRLRANYLPKAVSLDNVLEDGEFARGEADGVRGVSPRAISAYFLRQRQSAAKIGPVVSGIVAMLLRTHRLEGWAGIYKGAGPQVLQLFLIGFVTYIAFSASLFGVGGSSPYRAAPSGPGQFGFWSNLLFMVWVAFVALPLNVITYRTIVHPKRLSLTTPRSNLRQLLSHAEFTQPWRLYLVPGLLAATLCHVAWIGLATRIVRHLTVPSWGGLPPSTPASPDDVSNGQPYSGPSSETVAISPLGMAVFLAWCVLSVVILSPIECVMVRLSVQRPDRQQPLHLAYARAGQSSSTMNGGTAPSPAPYNNQAQVAAATAASAGSANGDAAPAYRDNDAAAAKEPAPRPSFAIEDEDEDEDAAAAAAGTEEGMKAKDDQPPREELAQGQDPVKQATTDATLPPTASENNPSNTQQQSQSHRVLGSATVPPPRPGTYLPDMTEPSEPVIALRPCDEPLSAAEVAQVEAEGFGAPVVERYTGLVDCLNKLVDEEGIEALYRGAWVTLLGVLAANFS